MALRDSVVVVTGGSAGVGRATAIEFARRGARVAILARGDDALKSARSDVDAHGPQALGLSVDVSNPDAVDDAATTIERKLGPIDVWVNNAMVSVFKPVAHLDPDEFERVTRVTYLGYVHGTMTALRRMRARNRGTIVQVGSALAYRSIPLQSAYCGAKHAIVGFTESLRTELLHEKSGVRVTMVDLPAMNTPQFHWVCTDLPRHPRPVPPIYQPEVAAEAIVWAAERAPRRVSVGATTALTIQAQKFVPGLIDRYLARTGIDAQQAEFPVEPGRPDNLWEPAPNDLGTHGEFDTQAWRRSAQWSARSRLRPLSVAAGVALAALALRRNRRAG